MSVRVSRSATSGTVMWGRKFFTSAWSHRGLVPPVSCAGNRVAGTVSATTRQACKAAEYRRHRIRLDLGRRSRSTGSP